MIGEVEKKKAILHSLVDRAVLDGNTLEIYPSPEKVAGVNIASPRGLPRDHPWFLSLRAAEFASCELVEPRFEIHVVNTRY